MRQVVVVFFIVCLTLAGCTTPARSSYEISGVVGQMNAAQAEQAERDVVAANRYGASGHPFDKPLQLLRAPQPAMPAADIALGVRGQVTASVRFNESGEAESVSIVSSTSESLARAVVAALSQWRIEPMTRDQKPVKPNIRQTFNFKTAP